MRLLKLNRSMLVLTIAYALSLTAGAAANIRINFIAKGSTWDLYPAAEILWVYAASSSWRCAAP